MGQEPATQEPPGNEPDGTAPAPAADAQPDDGQAPSQTFDADYVRKLREEAAGYRTRLKEIEDRDKTEAQRLAEERDTLRGELEPTKAENLRLRVALEKKLPPKLIDRLKGTTKEELEADADELLSEFVQPPTNFEPGVRGDGSGPVDMNARLRRAAGR